MRFDQFKQRDLVGKHVVWITGTPSRKVRQVSMITKVIKSGFYIDNESSRLFSYHTGEQIAGTQKTKCELLDDNLVSQTRQTLEVTNRKEQLVQLIINNRQKLINNVSLSELEVLASRINDSVRLTETVEPPLVNQDNKKIDEMIESTEQILTKLRSTASSILTDSQQLQVKIKQLKNGK